MNRERKKKLGKHISFALGILLSAVFLYLAFKDVDFGQMGRAMLNMDPGLLALALVVGVADHVVRTWRWQVLLDQGPASGFRPLYCSMMIGYLANNFLPMRTGEFVRLVVLKKMSGISKSQAGATVILERLADALLMLCVIGVGSFTLHLPPVVSNSARVAAAIFLSAGGVLVLLAFKGREVIRFLARPVFKVLGRFEDLLEGIFTRFLSGLDTLKSPRQALLFFALTLVVLALEALMVRLIMEAFGLHLPWFAALFLLTILGLSYILPAAPGAVGTFEFFCTLALIPFGVEHSVAAGLAIVLHAVILLVTSAQGLVGLFWAGLSLGSLAQSAEAEEEKGPSPAA